MRRREFILFIDKSGLKTEQTITTTPTNLQTSYQHWPVGLDHQLAPHHTNSTQTHNTNRMDWDINQDSLNFGRSDWVIDTSRNKKTPPGRIGTSARASANSARQIETSTRATTTHTTDWNFFFIFEKKKRREKCPLDKQPTLKGASLPEMSSTAFKKAKTLQTSSILAQKKVGFTRHIQQGRLMPKSIALGKSQG